MTANPKARSHLVERAAEAMSRSAGLVLDDTVLPPPSALPAATASTTVIEHGSAPAAPQARDGAAAVAPAVAREPITREPPRDPVTEETLVRAGLVATGRNRVSEEVTLIANQVLASARGPAERPGHDPRLILVTSARPGEGKSFTALNLAAGLALGAGRSVLLVDADGKRGCLSELLGASTAPGLRDLATDPSRRSQPLQIPTVHPRLSFMAYGTLTEGRTVPSQSLAVAIRGLGTAFPQHLIIIDSPPCLSASEASILAGVVGQVLMVVQAEQTQRGEVEAALDLVQVCPNLQLVLNGTTMSPKESFGAYDYGS